MGINGKRDTSMKREKELKESHKNFMGGNSWMASPLTTLKMVTASCFFGEPQYYRDEKTKKPYSYSGFPSPASSYVNTTLEGVFDKDFYAKTPKDILTSVIDTALATDLLGTLNWAVELRNVHFIRTTPQVIVVRAAMMQAAKGSGMIRSYARQVIQRMDEPAVQLAYLKSEFPGTPIPNGLKRAWADKLKEASPKQLAKYTMRKRMVKTVDVARLAYGKGMFGYETPIGALMRGELSLGEGNETWESMLSREGASTETWLKAIPEMGHMALLRNIANFTKHNVSPAAWVDRLIESTKYGKQLPFRYWTAYKMAQKEGARAPVLDAIEECLEQSVVNVPHIGGRSLVLADNSGSARNAAPSEYSSVKISDIGNMMGILTAKVSDDCDFAVFGNKLQFIPVRKKSSIFDSLREADMHGANIGLDTEHGIWLALDKAIREKTVYDSIFVYSDMQAGHGGLYGLTKRGSGRAYAGDAFDYPLMPRGRTGKAIDVPVLLNQYRREVNPNVDVFLVQIAGYNDTIVPEYYKRTYIIGGWSDQILKFAASMKGLTNNQ